VTHIITSDFSQNNGGLLLMSNVRLLNVPHPYKGMMAFSSDIDGSNIQRYMQVRELFDKFNIPFGDTFWFYNSAYKTKSNESDTISYYKGITDVEKDSYLILDGIASKEIDALHSYGNWSEGFTDFKRSFARMSTDELMNIYQKTGTKIEVWISHGDQYNIQNIGQEGRIAKTYQKGDIVGDDAYHTDLLHKSFIRFIWARNQTQTNDLILVLKKLLRRLLYSYDSSSLRIKIIDLLRDICADFIAMLSRGGVFGRKNLIFPIRLRDKSNFWGFERYTDNWHMDKLHLQISKKNLNRLISKNNLVIVANHFGYSKYKDIMVNNDTLSSLEYIKELQEKRILLIVNQSEILNYNLIRDCLNFFYQIEEDKLLLINIVDQVFGPRDILKHDLKGVSFTGMKKTTRVFIDSLDITDIFIYENTILYVPWS
jgi:hypothetical protein